MSGANSFFISLEIGRNQKYRHLMALIMQISSMRQFCCKNLFAQRGNYADISIRGNLYGN
jgi:hypothetical protein